MKTVLALSSALGCLGGLAAWSAPAAAAGGSWGAPEIEKIRAEAKTTFGTLPDKMPGSESDTPRRVALGEKLYFDKRLSVNESQSCNTCHRVDERLAGVDNEPTSEGAFDKRGDRNAPTVLNAGFHFAQFWDGRAADLKEQAKGPVLNPVEMSMPNEAEVLKRLQADQDYPPLFAAAFPAAAEKVTYDNMAEAIAAFERTLKTNDRFDDFLRGQDQALSAQELTGLRLFLDAGCTTCHNKALLGGNSYQKAGLIQPYENTEDVGRFKVTQDEDDKYKFKVPSLRNVALTAPYFHDGKISRLEDTVKKMGAMQLGKDFTAAEIDQLTAFLKSLSDKQRTGKSQI
jgi:cytochrome c peroxidase